jgi:hypothetical protein
MDNDYLLNIRDKLRKIVSLITQYISSNDKAKLVLLVITLSALNGRFSDRVPRL